MKKLRTIRFLESKGPVPLIIEGNNSKLEPIAGYGDDEQGE